MTDFAALPLTTGGQFAIAHFSRNYAEIKLQI